jgi:hypothetical protein
MAATVEESTPPDMATAIVLVGSMVFSRWPKNRASQLPRNGIGDEKFNPSG